LPPEYAGAVTSKLAEKYGELMTLQLGGTRWVFLNSSRVTRDILERRSAVFSFIDSLTSDYKLTTSMATYPRDPFR
jgi:hypothetical protein